MYLAVYFEHLQIQRRQHHQAAILVAQDKVAQVNELARQQGVQVGMGLGAASALCSELDVYPYNEQSERLQLLEIAASAYQRTSDIILCGSDCLVFCVQSMRMLYPNPQSLFNALTDVFDCFSEHYFYATGHTIEAAELLARGRQRFICEQPKACYQQLEKVSVQALLVSAQHKQQLQRLGLKTLKHVFALPVGQLRQRFHFELLDYLLRLKGHLKQGQGALKKGHYRFYQPQAQFSRHQELNFEIDNAERLYRPMSVLCEQLVQYLLQHQWQTQKITYTLLFREHAEQTLELQSVEPQGQAAPWLSLLTLKLEKLHLKAPVVALRIVCKHFVNLHGSNQSLFDKRQQGLAKQQLINVLHTRLGEQGCYRLAAQNAHIPELAQHAQSALMASKQTSLNAQLHKLRPNFLVEPTPLLEQVCLLRGPERIQSHWWHTQLIERDYYIAQNEQKQLCWVFKDKHRQWFIQGYFA